MIERAANLRRPSIYDRNCKRCPRLAAFRAETHARYPQYFSRPVPSFGARAPAVVIVGLAPGLHGANRTGRPFTGDHAGLLLYRTLYEAGLASRPVSTTAADALELLNARIVNSVKCVPPQNKPLPEEIRRCNTYLTHELAQLPSARVFLALGRIAHDALLMALKLPRGRYPFAHGREHQLEGQWMIDSYHCSRYNTQTGRLTPAMFRQVVVRACQLGGLDAPAARAVPAGGSL